jgi:uncharacterized protein YndB with AHSA1/START domain
MADKKQVIIDRVFKAPVERVWQAWTDPELVKKWWGPEGFTAPSVKSDLRVGGKYVYAMHGAAGTEFDKDMYSGGEFVEIVPNQKLVVTDYFCDEAGNKVAPSEAGMPIADFPEESTVTVLFADQGDGTTKLSIVYAEPETDAQWEAMLKSGMNEGWQSSLNKFEAVVTS